MITFSKIEERVKEQYHCWIIGKSLCVNLCALWQEAPPSESREPDSQHDYFLKNRRHRSPNLESQTPSRIAFSKIEEASFSESREPDPRQDCLFENRRGTTFPTSRAGSPWIKLVCNLHTQHQLSRYHRPLFQSALTELKLVKLAAPTTVL
ncbi:hypothetical protein ACFX14_014963 [Malus domestica]